MKHTRAIRILSIVLSLLIVVGITAISRENVLAAADATSGLSYTITGGMATITGFTALAGFDGTLVIPDTLGGASVTNIGDYAFTGCMILTNITIPSSITSIGNYAFTGCSSLSDAYFYGDAPMLGDSVFEACEADFTVNHLSTSTGYTNPWHGYNAVSIYTAGITYQTHVQDIGWLDWAKNGESAGAAGFSYRLEAIKVVLVPKGGAAPGATDRPFVQG